MRIQTDVYNVYKYSELCSEAKETAELEVREHTMVLKNELLYKDIMKNLKCLFPESRLKVQYSLSHCQEDGLNIYGELNTDDLLNYIQQNKNSFGFNINSKKLKRIKHYLYQTYFFIPVPKNASHYSYDYSDKIDIAEDMKCTLLNDLHYRHVDTELIEITENIVKTIFQHLNSQWERRGYECLYNVTEDELNAYEFYEDGKIYGLD